MEILPGCRQKTRLKFNKNKTKLHFKGHLSSNDPELSCFCAFLCTALDSDQRCGTWISTAWKPIDLGMNTCCMNELQTEGEKEKTLTLRVEAFWRCPTCLCNASCRYLTDGGNTTFAVIHVKSVQALQH